MMAAKQACEMSGVDPEDIKIAEVPDCCRITEAMAVADPGFFKPGREAAKADALNKADGVDRIPRQKKAGLFHSHWRWPLDHGQ